MTLVEQVMRDEGLRLKPYLDTVGKMTIGYGRNLDDVGITEAEARMMLENDLAKAEAAVTSRIPWAAGLDEVRRAALVNLAFNLGISGLLKFQKTLEHGERGDWMDMARELMNSKAATQAPNRYARLAEQLSTGTWV